MRHANLLPGLSASLPAVALVALSGCLSAYSPTEQAIVDASKEFDVPRDILVSLAFSASRFDNRDGEPNAQGGYGLMNLQEGDVGASIALASELLGVPISEIRHDDVQNIRAAAALLRYYADQLVEQEGIRLERLADWYPVLMAYYGHLDLPVQQSATRQVYRFLEAGLDAVTPAGEFFWIEPQELDLDDTMALSFSGTGDYAGAAQFVPADPSNYTDDSRGAADIDYIIIHTAQGSYSGTISWFQNPSANVSAHYVVRSSDGEVTQMLLEEDIGWHAGNWDYNVRSVGIEHEGYVEEPELWYTDAMYKASADLVRDIATRNGIPMDRDHIIGHYEVPGATHTDPGNGWDWDYFMSLVTGGTSTSSDPAETADPGTVNNTGSHTTGDLVGYVRVGNIYNTVAPVAGALVTLSDGTATVTDSNGYYEIQGVPRGAYTVTADAAGYCANSIHKYVQPGIVNWRSVALRPCDEGTASSGSGSGGSSSAGGVPGIPTDLWPMDYEPITSESVTLAWTPTGAAADSYETVIYWWDGVDWAWYYEYETTTPEKTFWPYVWNTYYAWTVRGVNSQGAGDWSEWGSFTFTP